MKKLLICALALALLLASAAVAEVGDRLMVVKCDEYITLREEPDKSSEALARIPLGDQVDLVGPAENGFLRVTYRGQTGYALEEYLTMWDSYRGEEVQLTREQRYNVNLFLSNFTEQGFLWRGGCYDSGYTDPALLTEFAVDHCWFNRPKQLEWGDYFNGNNVRVSEDQVAPIVKKYFGVSIKPSHDLRFIDYKKGYYYWEETGGHTSDGFACQYHVETYGGQYYVVWFGVFGGGEHWETDECYDEWRDASAAYPAYGDVTKGRAVIDVGSGGLNDRSTWRIERYAINYD